MHKPKRIGVDFDNTLVCYDTAFYEVAKERGLVRANPLFGKKAIRDYIRTLPNGESQWIELQASVYGPEIHRATLQPGAAEFLRCCHAKRIPAFIVSHKTAYPAAGGGQVNLRQAALEWMRERGFFHPDRLGLSEQHVFFEATRQEKLQRISVLGCTCFIDDLEEVFNEPDFPGHVQKILFSNGNHSQAPQSDVTVLTSWEAIQRVVLHE